MKPIRPLALILLVVLAGCSVTVTVPETARLTPSDAQKNDRFASSVAISGDQAIVGVPSDDHGGVDAGAAYVFQRTPMGWRQQVKLEATIGVAHDMFGFAVAIDGDTIVVGAPGVSRPSTSAGAVYVFHGSSSNWSQQARLQASDAAFLDRFGSAVAVNGQLIVVGAPSKDQFTGAAYVFERIGAIWAPKSKLTAHDATDHDQFGSTVAVSGVTAIIGAPGDDDGALDAGAAYVFRRFVGIWLQTKLNTSGALNRRNFGSAVSIDGDTAIVGASRDDSAAPAAGAGYVFHRNAFTGTWSPEARLVANDAQGGDLLGFAATLSGDTIVLGRQSSLPVGHGPGSAYIFSRSGTTWSQEAKLPTPSGTVSDDFGFAVSVSRGTVLISAPTDDEAGPNAGAAYTFTRPSNTWTLESRLTANGPAAEDEFGIAVSVSGNRAVVGADRSDFDINMDFDNIDVGAAYVYERQGSTWTEKAKLNSSDVVGGLGDLFGQSVAIDGDTIVVGAPDNDTVAPNAGAVYVDVRKGSTWTEQAKLTANDAAAGDLFGRSVAVSGNTLVVGALGDDDLGKESGSAYVFVRSGSTWKRQAKLTASDGMSGDGFALSVAISGDRAVAGAAANGPGATGAVYVFQRNPLTGMWSQAPKITARDGTSTQFFGWSVDIAPDRVVAGAPGDNQTGLNAGAVYVFGPAGNGWVQRCKLTAPGAKANQSLGWSVATDDSTVAAGSIGDDVRGVRSGSVFDFGLGALANLCPQRQHRLVGTDTAAGHTLGWSVAVSGGTIIAGATGAGATYVFPAAQRIKLDGAIRAIVMGHRHRPVGPCDRMAQAIGMREA